MGYKKAEPNMTFAELSLMGSMEHNRSLKLMEKINEAFQECHDGDQQCRPAVVCRQGVEYHGGRCH